MTSVPASLSLPALLGVPATAGCLLSTEQTRQIATTILRCRPNDPLARTFIGGTLSDLAIDRPFAPHELGDAPFLVLVGRQGAVALLARPEAQRQRCLLLSDPERVDRAALALAQLSDGSYGLTSMADAEPQRAFMASVIAALVSDPQLAQLDWAGLLPDERTWVSLAQELLRCPDAPALFASPALRQLVQAQRVQRVLLGQLDADQRQLRLLAAEGGPSPRQLELQPGLALNVIVNRQPGSAPPGASSGLGSAGEQWLGSDALTVVPLLRDDAVWGLLLAASPRPLLGPARATLHGLGALLVHNLGVAPETPTPSTAPAPAIRPTSLGGLPSLPRSPSPAAPGLAPLPGAGLGRPPMPGAGLSSPPMPGAGLGSPPMPGAGLGSPPMPGAGLGRPPMPGAGLGSPPMPGAGLGSPPMPGAAPRGPANPVAPSDPQRGVAEPDPVANGAAAAAAPLVRTPSEARRTPSRRSRSLVNDTETLLRHLADAVLLVDLQGRIVSYTPNAATALHLRGDVRGRTLVEGGASCLAGLLSEALMGDATPHGLVELPNGSSVQVSITSLEGELWAFVIAQSTATAPAQALLTDSKANASADPNAAVSETERNENFLSNFSNIIRIPLRELRDLITRVPAAGELNEQQSRLIGQVVRLNSELTMLVNDLLALGQIRLQAAEYRAPLRLDLLIDAAVGTQYAEFGRRGQQVTTDIPTGLPRVVGSEEGLGRVVAALIDNVIKYNPTGAQIRVAARHADGAITVSIEDNGPGLEEEELAQIFDPFYRAASAERFGVSGRGLGLTIAKAVIEQHDGQIWATSQPGKGCTFAFRIPCGG